MDQGGFASAVFEYARSDVAAQDVPMETVTIRAFYNLYQAIGEGRSGGRRSSRVAESRNSAPANRFGAIPSRKWTLRCQRLRTANASVMMPQTRSVRDF
jgi:hypothetical protein